ncbi:hypothetical protein SACE_7061 [Saccharopolyspora erythraea NRRL 2338]|uniref:Uncharacterized protein n=1 Tax=Saccharopolyspora erythraea (strain ATCC 11635 / DSM 40517 / JCM 4748 / NBRC 13426 / NCIMB 8594 / NRRL 2338) TaxID=405948 RepID=A4FQ97_SACEN|nr:hypothetical protein SACE_7061 [Saccharopolyspora erythraea NRRL 2338]
MVTRSTGSAAEILPAANRDVWRAFERWTREQLAAAAEANPAVEVVETPTGHDAHRERPDLVTALLHERLRNRR